MAGLGAHARDPKGPSLKKGLRQPQPIVSAISIPLLRMRPVLRDGIGDAKGRCAK